MGMYSSQYENYYSKLRKTTYGSVNKNLLKNRRANGRSKGLINITPSSVVKTIIFQLVSMLLLLSIVTVSKANLVPNSDIVYNWFKNNLDKNIEYKAIALKVSSIKMSDFEEKFQEVFEKIREGLTGEETTKSFIKNNFNFDMAQENSLLSAYDGTVKTVGSDSSGNKYVVINHGKGIETKYTNLKDIYVKKDDTISKGSSIGSYINEIDYQDKIELLYMGRNVNYMEYVSE